MRMYPAFNFNQCSLVVACVVLSSVWTLAPIARAQVPSDVGRSVGDCLPGIMDGFITQYFDLVASRALAAQGATADSDLGRQIASARERTRRVIGEFESDEVTPAKMRKAMMLTPNMAAHIDIYDAEVARLQASGGISPASVAERAWLRARDVATNFRGISEPNMVTAFQSKDIVFALDYPLSDNDRSALLPNELSNSSYSLLAFMALHGVPGIRFPGYGTYRTDELRKCTIAPGPRDVAGFLAFDAMAYSNKPMLDAFYYGATDGLDLDKVVLYFQPFIEALAQMNGCDGTINQANYAALVAQFPLSYGRRMLNIMRDRPTGNLDEALKRGSGEAQQTMQPSMDGAVPGTLNSARHHASNRQVITLETGTWSRSKSAPDHAAIRHVVRRVWGTHLSEVSAVQ